MLSRSMLLKSNSYVVKDENKVIIDSNERLAAKIEAISEMLKSTEEPEFTDEFSQGLEADQVAALLEDGEESENVIKANPQPVYDGPSPEELIANAQAQIEQMKQSAMEEMDALRENTLQSARDEGYKQGYDQGYQEGVDKASQMEEAVKQELAEREQALMEQYQSKMQELEPELMDTLTDIYEHVFSVKLSEYRNVILHLISTTLHRIDGSVNYLVRVSAEDYPFVSMQKQSVLEPCVTGSAKLEVIEDVTLSRNECMIETDSGIYDCSVGTELKELKKELVLLSYEK